MKWIKWFFGLVVALVLVLAGVKRTGNLGVEMGVNKEEVKIRMVLGGDVMLGRTVMTKSQDVGDYNYPFVEIGGYLREADIVSVNLESPFWGDCPRSFEGYIFCAEPRMIEGLVNSGIDVVSLANNHAYNYGEEGLDYSKKLLDEKGIRSVGWGNVEVVERAGVEFGFLGFDFVSGEPREEDFDLVRKADQGVDVVVVNVHWGWEYQDWANNHQKDWARRLVESGADVVVGHHPHWVQEIERIGEAVVMYSLGNLVFDQMWSEETRKGLLVELVFEGKEIVEIKEKLIYMEKWGQPKIVY